MYDSMDDLYQEGIQMSKRTVATNMLSYHHTPEYIASILELPIEEVKKLGQGCAGLYGSVGAAEYLPLDGKHQYAIS